MGRTLALGVVLISAVVMVAGCQFALPPQEAILAGTWKLEAAPEAGLSSTTITFDDRGELVLISIQSSSTVHVEPVILRSSTSVDGQNVTINASMLAFDTFHFTGTLDEARTIASGSLTTNVNLGVVKIVIDNGSATLTRQP